MEEDISKGFEDLGFKNFFRRSFFVIGLLISSVGLNIRQNYVNNDQSKQMVEQANMYTKMILEMKTQSSDNLRKALHEANETIKETQSSYIRYAKAQDSLDRRK